MCACAYECAEVNAASTVKAKSGEAQVAGATAQRRPPLLHPRLLHRVQLTCGIDLGTLIRTHAHAHLQLPPRAGKNTKRRWGATTVARGHTAAFRCSLLQIACLSRRKEIVPTLTRFEAHHPMERAFRPCTYPARPPRLPASDRREPREEVVLQALAYDATFPGPQCDIDFARELWGNAAADTPRNRRTYIFHLHDAGSRQGGARGGIGVRALRLSARAWRVQRRWAKPAYCLQKAGTACACLSRRPETTRKTWAGERASGERGVNPKATEESSTLPTHTPFTRRLTATRWYQSSAASHQTGPARPRGPRPSSLPCGELRCCHGGCLAARGPT